MLEGVVALLLLALLFDFLFYKGHSQSSCQKNACNNKTSLTDKYSVFSVCVFKCVFVYLKGCAVSDLPRVRLTETVLHTKNKAAWDSSNPLMMFNDTYQWWDTHTQLHPSNPSRSSSTLPTVELQTGDNQVSPQVLGDWGVHKHSWCSSVLLPAVIQQGAPVELTQAS